MGNLLENKGVRPQGFEPVTSPVYCLDIARKEMGLAGIEMGILAEKGECKK